MSCDRFILQQNLQLHSSCQCKQALKLILGVCVRCQELFHSHKIINCHCCIFDKGISHATKFKITNIHIAEQGKDHSRCQLATTVNELSASHYGVYSIDNRCLLKNFGLGYFYLSLITQGPRLLMN